MAGRDAHKADPLENFSCIKGKRYLLPEKWYYKSGDDEFLNVRKALNDLPDFVRDVRSLPPKRYPRKSKVDVADLKKPLEQGPAVEKGNFSHHESKYKYAGPQSILNCEGKLRSAYKRVILTPSKGRWDNGLLRWSSEEKLVETLGVVVVPLNELKKYSEKWGKTRLIIGVDYECVGGVRYHIIQLARYWGLETFWMIDDSVPTSNLYKTWGNQKESFDCVLETIEEMPSQDRFSKAALIGLTSTFSTQNLSESADQYAINKRTPTSCVFVCLGNVPKKLNYEWQLPSKEDVIFAAQLIDAGKDVIIDRHIHFEDYPFRVGGCADYRGNEDTDSEDTDSEDRDDETADNGSALARMKLSN